MLFLLQLSFRNSLRVRVALAIVRSQENHKLRLEETMADTYSLGSIPPLFAWEGETLTFNVTSNLGNPIKSPKPPTPSPKGKMTIDEKTGVFTYTPAAEDKDEIAVWIRARKGAKDEKQKVFITPHPQLSSEF